MSGDDLKASGQPKSAADLPKRFYEAAKVRDMPGGWTVELDGRPVRTPGRQPLVVPTEDLAEALAREWEAQEPVIDPAAMPLTRLCNAAIDGVAQSMEAVAEDAARFTESDLLCYRAESPQALVERQNDHWDPLIAWAREELGLPLNLAGGVMHVAQPPETLAKAKALLKNLDVFALTGMHVMTSLTGSAIIALAVVHERLSAEEAWAVSLVDENWQIQQWGEDAEANKRREMNWREMRAAAQLARISRR